MPSEVAPVLQLMKSPAVSTSQATQPLLLVCKCMNSSICLDSSLRVILPLESRRSQTWLLVIRVSRIGENDNWC